MQSVDFSTLSPNLNINPSDQKIHIQSLWQQLFFDESLTKDIAKLSQNIDATAWQTYASHWQSIDKNDDKALTDWLISLFNHLFNQPNIGMMPTTLVRGDGEPEYFPTDDKNPARIEFAHGFFASSLHEISHWCIAGKARRTLNDFGYWYESDGRNEQTQAIFEQVEIKPQAIECLLNQACGRYFYVSQDNLNADFDTSKSTFATDVYAKAQDYLSTPNTLPRDAKRLLWILLRLCQGFTPTHFH
ncbi:MULTISPECIES: elongation factor P hydroxylase [unclassified Moraxella]|uniref:elongation factor P hydroxylase n=1 Tax=unclassified Moraxella TaxID=2685852 RepID=UPI00359D77A2